MRGDQPVVSAASWMVRASTRRNLTTRLSRFRDPPAVRWAPVAGPGPRPRGAAARGGAGGALRRLGRQEHRLAVLVRALVQAHRGEQRLVRAGEAFEDRVERHGVVALPGLLDPDLRPGA